MTHRRHAPLALAAALALAATPAAQAASLTPPNLVAASSLNNPDLLLVWPYAAGGPLESMSWSVFKGQMASGLSGSFLAPGNNLSDLGNPTIARTNLGLPLGTSGASLCLLSSVCSWSALQSFAASGTGAASINIPQGVAPTSPNNGDIWNTSAAHFVRLNGVTHQLLAADQNLADLASATTARVNLGLNVNGAVKVTTAGAVSQAACADLSNGGNGGCSLSVVSGTWTPTFSFDTPGTSTFTYSTQSAYFVCYGPVVYVEFRMAAQVTKGTASGSLEMNGLPYVIGGATASIGSVLQVFGGGFTGLQSLPYISQEGSLTAAQLSFSSWSGLNQTFIQVGQLVNSATFNIIGSFTYRQSGTTC